MLSIASDIYTFGGITASANDTKIIFKKSIRTNRTAKRLSQTQRMYWKWNTKLPLVLAKQQATRIGDGNIFHKYTNGSHWHGSGKQVSLWQRRDRAVRIKSWEIWAMLRVRSARSYIIDFYERLVAHLILVCCLECYRRSCHLAWDHKRSQLMGASSCLWPRQSK